MCITAVYSQIGGLHSQDAHYSEDERLGSLMGEAKILASRSGGPSRGGQSGGQSAGPVPLEWQERRSSDTSRINSVRERSVPVTHCCITGHSKLK